jgi:hypothetical protein
MTREAWHRYIKKLCNTYLDEAYKQIFLNYLEKELEERTKKNEMPRV